MMPSSTAWPPIPEYFMDPSSGENKTKDTTVSFGDRGVFDQ
jgi:hypothetical protein